MLRDPSAATAEGLPVTSPPVLVDLPRIRERRGVLFLAVRTNSRPAIATTIERLIDFLDAQEADPDMEEGADAEPWLGWNENAGKGCPSDGVYRFSADNGTSMLDDDRELENEHGDDEHDGDGEFLGGSVMVAL